MHSLKYTFFGLLIAIALFFLWALSLPSELHVQKSKTYQSDIDLLFSELSDFYEWTDWFPWMDEGMQFEIEHEKATHGHKLSWKHPEQGSGYIEMCLIESPTEIQQKLQFTENSEVLKSDFRLIEKQTGGTEIIWTISNDDEYPYPLGRVRAFVIRKMSEKNMQQALDDIPFHLEISD
ncbi:MAG: hypothetical protein U9N51_00545 [Bacteroidota bacterium]|nr:hypothetical protein [Bacteroidota bacterium]